VLRGVTLGALALALWQRLVPAPARQAAATTADERTLGAALARWTAGSPPAAHVALDTLPGARTRDWLAALAAAGTPVTWRAREAPPLVAAAEPVADPAGGVRVDVALPTGVVHVRDALGALDSMPVQGGGASLRLPLVGAALEAAGGGARAGVALPTSGRLGAVVVVGSAGWESKFAVAALEERGWTVRARLTVAPGISVTQSATRTAGGAAGARAASTIGTLDTASVAAVVLLDSAATVAVPGLGGALTRYVQSGGGLVLAGDAARAPAAAALAPARSGTPTSDTAALHPLERLRPDAVPLAWGAHDGRRTLVGAARRVGAGRVVQSGHGATWRRRFDAADEAGPAAHQAWWAALVAAAAYVPVAPATGEEPPAAPPPVTPTSPAPLAAIVAALGPPTTPTPPYAVAGDEQGERATPDSPWPLPRVPDTVLVPLALAALLAEVASRRLRGLG
jgi:hypothetical protein